MKKGVRIVYRKTITNIDKLRCFEKLSGRRLPKHTDFKNTRLWQFDMTKESGRKALMELLELFEMPAKDITVDRLFCKMIVRTEDNVLFEIHEWDNIYQQMSDMGRI